jgi:signal transduction histidine kinase
MSGPRKLNKNNPGPYLIVIMAAVTLLVASVIIGSLYFVALDAQRAHLVQTAKSQARLIESVVRYDTEEAGMGDVGATFKDTLVQIREAYENYEGFGSTGEFTIGKLQGDNIVFVLRHRQVEMEKPMPVSMNSTLAEPMRRALKGESGDVVALDYDGKYVLAAYEPIDWDVFTVGIVAKVDMAEVRAPFIKSAVITGVFALLMIAIGAFVFRSVTRGLLDSLKLAEEEYRNEKDDSFGAGAPLPHATDKARPKLLALSIVIAAGVFYFDLSMPLGVAGGVPYIVLVLVSFWLPGKSYTLLAAIAGTVLTMVGFFLSPPAGVMWIVLINRFLALFAIWVTAVLILHRKNMEEEREALVVKLGDVNQEMEAFSYAVSHDLKAPLRAIHNYADFLLTDLAGTLEEEQEEYLNGLGEAVQQGEGYIEDLLELSQVSKHEVKTELVDSEVFLHELVRSLSYPTEVEVVVKGGCPTVTADPTLMRQIFQNLIENAVKYNESATKRVEVGSNMMDNGTHEFFVRDNGIGIDNKYFKKIFRPFQRLHSNEEYAGSGIGLASVLKAASRLDWILRVESTPGEGSTFFVATSRTRKE